MQQLNGIDFDSFVLTHPLPVELRILNLNVVCGPAEVEIFTDGSGLDGGVGFSVCVFRRGVLCHHEMYRLRHLNSVFQAELLAIFYAVEWAIASDSFVFIYSDSLSCIQALSSVSNKSSVVQNIKNYLGRHVLKFCIVWVKAHVGVPGNEIADQFARDATVLGSPVDCPASY